MNAFRSKDGSLNKGYLRICAAYKLMAARKITKERAIDLLEQRNVHKAVQTVETWSFKSQRPSS